MKTVEYRVRPVVRYVITEYERFLGSDNGQGGSKVIGEFDNEQCAEKAVEALNEKARMDGLIERHLESLNSEYQSKPASFGPISQEPYEMERAGASVPKAFGNAATGSATCDPQNFEFGHILNSF